MSLFNSIIMGYPNGLYIDATKGKPTDDNIPATLFVKNNIIAGCPTPILYSISGNTNVPVTQNTTATITSWYNTASYGNEIYTNTTDAGLTDPFNYSSPDFNPASASAKAATGAAFTNTKLSGLTAVSYRGACAVGDTWWKGWTKY